MPPGASHNQNQTCRAEKIARWTVGVGVSIIVGRSALVHGALPLMGDELNATEPGHALLEATYATYDAEGATARGASQIGLSALSLVVNCDAPAPTIELNDGKEPPHLNPNTYKNPNDLRSGIIAHTKLLMDTYGFTFISPEAELAQLDETDSLDDQIQIMQSYFTKTGTEFKFETRPGSIENPKYAREFFKDILLAESTTPKEESDKVDVPIIKAYFDARAEPPHVGLYDPTDDSISFNGFQYDESPLTIFTIGVSRHEHGHRLDIFQCGGAVTQHIDPDYRKLDDDSIATTYGETNIVENKAEITAHMDDVVDQNNGTGKKARLVRDRLNSVVPGLGEYYRDLSAIFE